MKIPKEKPVCQDGEFKNTKLKTNRKFLVTAKTANSLNYNKDILNKQESLQNIFFWIGDRNFSLSFNLNPTTPEGILS